MTKTVTKTQNESLELVGYKSISESQRQPH